MTTDLIASNNSLSGNNPLALVGLPAPAPDAPRHIAISGAAFDRLTTTQAAALRERIRALVEAFLREVKGDGE